MIKTNYKDDETRLCLISLLVQGGTDVGTSGYVPGYLLNKLEDVIKEIMDWQQERNK